MLEQAILFLVSLAANIFSAFSGGGAGLVQLPALIFLGLPFGVALATHKLASVALGVGATLRHLRESSMERRFAVFILATGLPGVVVGASLILRVPDRSAQIALGVLTAGLGVYSWSRKGLGQVHAPTHRDWRGYRVGGIVLTLIGVLNGSLTSGTGLFVTLWLVRWFGLDYKRGRLYAGIGGNVLERRRRADPGFAGRHPLGLAASAAAGLAAGRLSRRPPVHRQGQPLDQARLRDRDPGRRCQADYGIRIHHRGTEGTEGYWYKMRVFYAFHARLLRALCASVVMFRIPE